MRPDLFPGAAPLLPERSSSPFALRPVHSPSTRVRYVAGYEEFAEFCSIEGADPVTLRDDLRSMMRFLLQHPELLDDHALLRSAGIFLGNAIAALHPESQWQVLDEPSVGPDGYDFPVFKAVQGLIEHPEWHDKFHEAATHWSAPESAHT